MQTYTRPPPRKHFRFGDIAMMNAEVRFCQILLASRRVRVPLIQPNVLLRKSYGNTRKLKACALADLKRLEKHLVGNSLVALDVLRELGRQGVTIESVNAVFVGLKAALRPDPIVHQGRSKSGHSEDALYLWFKLKEHKVSMKRASKIIAAAIGEGRFPRGLEETIYQCIRNAAKFAEAALVYVANVRRIATEVGWQLTDLDELGLLYVQPCLSTWTGAS
jgi:hypothetical protein